MSPTRFLLLCSRPHRIDARVLRSLIAMFLLAACSAVAANGTRGQAVVAAARAQIGVTTAYDPSYSRIAYPLGDVPLSKGVCTDVVIRAHRKLGLDFQALVHEDMASHFSQYPQIWGLKRPDRNIDHRRVPNLERFLERRGKAVSPRNPDSDFKAGDTVSWRLNSGLPHIGLVSDKRTADGSRPLVIHNIGRGTQEEDVLLAWKRVGHYRWFNNESGVR